MQSTPTTPTDRPFNRQVLKISVFMAVSFKGVFFFSKQKTTPWEVEDFLSFRVPTPQLQDGKRFLN